MNDKKILVITAHADDEEFFAGGTLAKFAAEGWEIEVMRGFDLDRFSPKVVCLENVNGIPGFMEQRKYMESFGYKKDKDLSQDIFYLKTQEEVQ